MFFFSVRGEVPDGFKVFVFFCGMILLDTFVWQFEIDSAGFVGHGPQVCYTSLLCYIIRALARAGRVFTRCFSSWWGGCLPFMYSSSGRTCWPVLRCENVAHHMAAPFGNSGRVENMQRFPSKNVQGTHWKSWDQDVQLNWEGSYYTSMPLREWI